MGAKFVSTALGKRTRGESISKSRRRAGTFLSTRTMIRLATTALRTVCLVVPCLHAAVVAPVELFSALTVEPTSCYLLSSFLGYLWGAQELVSYSSTHEPTFLLYTFRKRGVGLRYGWAISMRLCTPRAPPCLAMTKHPGLRAHTRGHLATP